jgi:hypothetical protein
LVRLLATQPAAVQVAVADPVKKQRKTTIVFIFAPEDPQTHYLSLDAMEMTLCTSTMMLITYR